MNAIASTITTPRTNRRTRRIATAAAILTAGIITLGASAADASTNQQFSLFSHNGHNVALGSATQSGWTDTVTVSVRLLVMRGECVNVYEQGHNSVRGYGSWQLVKSACGAGGNFSFTVSDYYSDSVALKIVDGTGSASTHVWN